MDNTTREDAVDFILKEEYAMAEEPQNARMVGIATSTSFLIVGLVPLIVYIIDAILDLNSDNLFLVSSILTGLAFLGVGWARGRITHSSKLKASIETLNLGLIAAGAAYGIGFWLDSVFGV